MTSRNIGVVPACLLILTSAAGAGVTLPDCVLVGTIRVNGAPVSAQTDALVYAKVDTDGDGVLDDETPVGTYRMGTRAGIGDRYALRIRVESNIDGEPQSRNAARVGQTAALYVQMGAAAPVEVGLFFIHAPGLVTTRDLVLDAIGLRGDLNCDGAVTNFDIDAFVLLIADPAGYAAQYPMCSPLAGDINDDGVVNNFDIDPFILCLVNQGCR